jgi:WD40 repeat protein
MADVFISYSRRDQEFVRELAARLSERGKDCWVDWDDIPPTAEFLQEIYEGIEASNAFLFVISPDSARSDVCRKEVEHAAENHKRIVPLLRHEPDGTPLPEAVASLNWILVPESVDLDAAVDDLVEVLGQDLEHVRRHTRTLQKALEWSRADEDASLLLRGSELRAAEEWIEAGAEKEPAPTPLHYRYLQASRAGATRRQRQTVAAFAIGIVIALALAVVALIQRSHAVKASHVAESRLLASEASSVMTEQDQLETGALLALAAYRVKPTPEARQSLSQAVQKSDRLVALLAPGSHVTAVQFTPDGSLLAAGLTNGTVLVWDVARRELIDRLRAGAGMVVSLSFSRDGKRLAASFSRDGKRLAALTGSSVAVWRQSGRKFERAAGPTVPAQACLTLPVNSCTLAFAPDGRLLVGTQRGVEAWNASGSRKLACSRYALTKLAVARDGLIACGTIENAAVVKPGASPQAIVADFVNQLTFAPRGDILGLIVVKEAFLWTPGASAARRVAKGAQSLAFTPGGSLVTGGSDGKVFIRRVLDGSTSPSRLLGRLGPAPVESIAANRGLVAAAGAGGLALWSISGSARKSSLSTHFGGLEDLLPTDEHRLLVAYDDRVETLDLESRSAQALREAPAGLWSLAASRGGGLLAAGGLDRPAISTWKDGRHMRTILPKDEPYDLAIDPDGIRIAEATYGRRVRFWHLGRSGPPATISVPLSSYAIGYDRTGHELTVVGSEGRVVRVDIHSGRVHDPVSLGGPTSSAVAISADGSRVAAARTNATTGTDVVLLDGTSGSPTVLTGPTATSTFNRHAVAFDARGDTVAAGNDTGSVFLWSGRDGHPLAPSLPLHGEVVALGFDPLGSKLIVGLKSGKVVLLGRAYWDAAAAIRSLCATLGAELTADQRAAYHVPGSVPSRVCP